MSSWHHPFTCIVAGPTSCGKSVFVSKFLHHIKSMIDNPIAEVVWCYGEKQQMHDALSRDLLKPIRFIQGLAELNEVAPESRPPSRLLIVDDLMREAKDEMVDIFSKGRGTRDMSLNAHYIVMFKNPRDRSQITHFARQVFPENPRFIRDAYQDATKRGHSYLLFDLKQTTDDALRFRTNIFPGESNAVYVQKKDAKKYSNFAV